MKSRKKELISVYLLINTKALTHVSYEYNEFHGRWNTERLSNGMYEHVVIYLLIRDISNELLTLTHLARNDCRICRARRVT